MVLLTHRLSLLAARFGWSAEVQEAVAAEVADAAESGGASSIARFSPISDTRGASPTLPPDGGWEPPLPANPLQERYVDLGLLGTGGMGEVRRVHDRRLGRTAALKSLRRELATHGPARARFVAEAEITAQLTHPGVIPVYDIGTLGDGRPFYTMKEVTGRTLAAAVAALHTMRAPGEPELRRVVSLFVRVAETVAYAHDRGITHRDLKPDNVMIGAFGEVLVLDWGLARLGAQAEVDEAIQLTVGATRQATRVGTVTGTPAYMAPEQAAGRIAEVGPASDVWALGAVLYEILTGNPPYTGTQAAILTAVRAGPPPAPTGPAELVDIVVAAMSALPADRPAAASLADRAQAWLDGSTRRARALELVQEADQLAEQARIDRERGAVELAAARARLAAIPAWAPPAEKREGWEAETAAEARREAAELDEVREVEALHAALSHAPALPEAHGRLADLYRAALVEAESAGDVRAAAKAELRLRTHDRGRYAAWLEGRGALTLVTDPPGAHATLHRYVERERRLVPELVADLGPTPLVARDLARGTWLVRLTAPGRAPVAYPVLIGRGEHWDGASPDGPRAVRLPLADEVHPDEVFVPAGWAWTGSRTPVDEELPVRRVWIDDLYIQRFPVTNADFLTFLDALVAEGREGDAIGWCPRTPDVAGRPGSLLYGRTAAGGFCLVPDDDGDLWSPDWPVYFVNRSAMDAYAAWLGARTGRALRLPHELEWEKAGRGVDLRRYPWGDRFDPAFCQSRESRPGRPSPGPVGAFPTDESPYGVRDMAGGATDLCRNRYHVEGPPIDAQGRLVLDDAGPDEYHCARGGAWDYLGRACQLSQRFLRRGTGRRSQGSFRLVRDART